MQERNHLCIDMGLENKFNDKHVHSEMSLFPSELPG